LTLSVAPSFTSVRKEVDYPKDDMTSLFLTTTTTATADTFVSGMVVRLINFGLDDGLDKVPVDANADAASASLIFDVGHFSGNLSYDPGACV
jgi:hypothetical protein